MYCRIYKQICMYVCMYNSKHFWRTILIILIIEGNFLWTIVSFMSDDEFFVYNICIWKSYNKTTIFWLKFIDCHIFHKIIPVLMRSILSWNDLILPLSYIFVHSAQGYFLKQYLVFSLLLLSNLRFIFHICNYICTSLLRLYISTFPILLRVLINIFELHSISP